MGIRDAQNSLHNHKRHRWYHWMVEFQITCGCLGTLLVYQMSFPHPRGGGTYPTCVLRGGDGAPLLEFLLALQICACARGGRVCGQMGM